MAASIRDTRNDPKNKKPILVDRIDEFDSDIYQAKILPKEDGFISISDDRSIRIWLKRDTGKYWPSVCHYAESNPTSLFYHPDPRRLFIGLENGSILEFAVGEDYNKITLLKQYLAHSARVTSVYYSLEHDWVLSTSRDKTFAYHSTDSARLISRHTVKSFTTYLAFDSPSRHCFVGCANGLIEFLKLTDNKCEYKSTLTGHSTNITCLSWDPKRQFLFSSSYDKEIICWDVGGQKGTTYDLEGHKDRVTCVQFVDISRQLISCSEDSKIVVWDMNAKRRENPLWEERDECQYCKKPFFWNFKSMWELKSIGKRQHHCRRCGAAICDDCSKNRSSIPVLGHEFQVRICKVCIGKINDEELTSLATFHETKHAITTMSFDDYRNFLLTIGTDRTIKIWDMSPVLTI